MVNIKENSGNVELKHYGYIAYLRAVFLSVGEYHTINSKKFAQQRPSVPQKCSIQGNQGRGVHLLH